MISYAPKQFCSAGLAKLLARTGIATEDDIIAASNSATSSKAVAALAMAGKIDEHAALRTISNALAIPLFDDQVDRSFAPELFTLINRAGALANRYFPIRLQDEVCWVAFADPLEVEVITELEFSIQKQVRPVLASERLILELIGQYLPDEYTEFDQMQEISAPNESVEVLVAEHSEIEASENSISAAPIVRLVNKILFDAAAAGASDIHLEPTADHLDVRFRIDGIMRAQLTIPRRLQTYVIARIKLLARMDLTEKRRPQDGRFRIRTGARSNRDIRASSVPTAFGENLVLRLLRPDIEGLSFHSLGVPSELQQALHRILHRSDRLFIVTGPTGSGKTTTLYAALASIRTGTTTIVTVEDPIEFRVEGATQIQVDTKIGVTFASGLRSILRQDPDIILVGEIRDLEAAEIAFQAAQTGHLVLSTLHTNDAPSAVIRLLDLGLDPTIIAASLGGILAQRLVRKVCSSCARELTVEEREQAELLELRTTAMRHGAGCGACGHSGFKGRIGVYSLLNIDEQIRSFIRERSGEDKIANYARAHGYLPLEESARALIEQGYTTIAEAERVIGSIRPAASAPVINQDILHRSPPVVESAASLKSVAELAAAYQEQASPEIMLIDDDASVRAVMAKTLRRAGFEVVEAHHGKEALELLQQIKPALIICDLQMPEMNGREFVENIRSRPDLKIIPVIMLTGMENEEVELGLIELGADDFISKSSSPAVVLARIKRLLK